MYFGLFVFVLRYRCNSSPISEGADDPMGNDSTEKSPCFQEERQEKILELLDKNSTVRVSELSELFGTSAATIRKDIRKLEQAGKLKRTHGGAIKIDINNTEVTPASAAVSAHDEKVRIGHAAAQLVHDGDTFIVQAGTTNIEFVRALRGKHDLKIITNDLLISLEVEKTLPDSSVIQIGGDMRFGFHYTEGSEALSQLIDYYVPTAYMCTNAYSFERGFSTHRIEQSSWLTAVYHASERHVMLLDSTKIGVNALSTHAKLEDMDVFITDSNLDEATRLRLAEEAPNVQLIFA